MLIFLKMIFIFILIVSLQLNLLLSCPQTGESNTSQATACLRQDDVGFPEVLVESTLALKK
jgi:hypothetical protein